MKIFIKTASKSASSLVKQLSSRLTAVGATILICATASAQNLMVSGNDNQGGEIYKFTWDGAQSIFASGLTKPLDVVFDSTGNLFVGDFNPLELVGYAAIFKISPNGLQTVFAWGLSYPSYLAIDRTNNLYVADYNSGVIYKYKPSGSRATFASGLYHPMALACDSANNLWIADNSAGNIHQGGIYRYAPDGSRVTVGVLDRADRPADLAFDSLGDLFMADSGGKIYKYNIRGVLRRPGRTTFGSVPHSAESLGFDTAGNLFVLDAGDENGNGNVIYKFTAQGVRSVFAPVSTSDASPHQTFSRLTFQPMACCQ
jgi:hypothetical protein